MAITLFGVATNPADNSNATGPTVTLTPPASMVDGDLVFVSCRYRASSGTIIVSNAGGQTWFAAGSQYNTTNIRAAGFWCRFNGTWSANPVFGVSSGTNNVDAQMLVFRPTSAAYTWTLESGENAATFSAPSTPFTVTITGRTTTAASTVSIGVWSSVDDNSWGNLSGTGWSKTSLTAQYRNNGTNDNSSAYAYNIKTSAGATNDVSQDQTALGGDAGETALYTFAEILVTTAPTGVSGTMSAGSLAISQAYVGLAGQEVAVSAGTLTVPSGGNATATPSGVSSAMSAGSPTVNLGPVVPVTGVSSAVSAGSTTESTSSVPVGVAATVSAGTAVGIGANPGTALPAGVSATAQAGSLASAITTVGIAGAQTTAQAGTASGLGAGATGATTQPTGVAATAQAGSLASAITVVGPAGVQATAEAGIATGSGAGILHGAGQPPGIPLTIAAGIITVPTLPLLVGVQADVIAESLGASLIVAEIDGVVSTVSAGNVIFQTSASLPGVQATAQVGSPTTTAQVVAAPASVELIGAVGTAAGVPSGSGVGVAEGVESAAVAGTASAAWTNEVTLSGVESVVSAGTATVQGGESVSDETFPAGVESIVQLGEIFIGEARAAPAGVSIQVRAGVASARGTIETGIQGGIRIIKAERDSVRLIARRDTRVLLATRRTED